MKVTKTGNRSETIIKSYKGKVEGTKEFSLALDMANKEHTESELREMLKDIEKLGKKLVATKSLEDAKQYRNKIQEYIAYIVKNVYSLKIDSSPFNFGIHMRIEVINSKLNELTGELLNEQRETIELAERIEEIRGLLVDVYK